MLPIVKRITSACLRSLLLPAYCFSVLFLPFGCQLHVNKNMAADVPSYAEKPKKTILDSSFTAFAALENANVVFSFYKSASFYPVWVNEKGATPVADSLLAFIKDARFFGLLPQHYYFDELDQVVRDTLLESSEIQHAELRFTEAFLNIARHLRFGRLAVDSVTRTRADSVGSVLLAKCISKGVIAEVLRGQQPPFTDYHRLRDALRGLILSDTLNSRFFLLGKTVDTSLVSSRITTVEVNLDRWRTEGRSDEHYIWVNLPSYTLRVFNRDLVTFESRVIVGAQKSPTPVLDGLIKSFTIFPKWNVPRNIAVTEVLPKLKRDSLYLRSHNYEVVDAAGNVLNGDSIEWRRFHRDNFPFMIRQREGKGNSLGLVKLSFSNPYDVYLHDTNARNLFNRTRRSLSHGCVRVEKVIELARYLVKDDQTYCSPEDLDQYLELGKTMTIRVPRPMAVHLRYYTCEVSEGAVVFHEDIYGLDTQAKQSVYQQVNIGSPAVASTLR